MYGFINQKKYFKIFLSQLLSLFFFLGVLSSSLSAQTDSLKNRRKLIIYSYSTVYAASVVGFHQLWYKNYDQESFHFFNDNDQWLMMDKLGHGFSAYALTKYTAKSYEWAGIEKDKATLYGGLTSTLLLTTVEVFDGFSSEWGFSWGDFLANIGGSALSYTQQRFLKEEILALKYSYMPTKYRAIRPEILGSNHLEGLLKDYNGQTYWASLNLNALSKQIKWEWLNIAFGYSGQGMLRGRGSYQIEEGTIYHPQRQYFLSLDLNLERIPTQNPFLKTVLSVFNVIKVPFPAVEFHESGKAKFHYLYF